MSRVPFHRFRLTIETRTPLHIGSGLRYHRDYDFVVEGTFVRLVDVDRALDSLPDADVNRMRDGRVAALLPAGQRDRYTRSLLQVHGSREVGQDLLGLIRDGNGAPYIPGSSLKGAFRSALLDEFLRQDPQLARRKARELLSRGHRREFVARDLESEAFDVELERTSRNADAPNRDINRWLRISDAYPREQFQPIAAEIQVRSSSSRGQQAIPVWVEAIPAGVRFAAELSLTPESFAPWSKLDQTRRHLFGDDLLGVLQAWGAACRANELDYWRRVDSAVASRFAGAVAEESRSFPLGFGTGWLSKTIGRHLRGDEQLLKELITKFGLSRSRSPDPKNFPMGHRVIDGPGGPVPPGWVEIVEVAPVS